MKKKDQVNIVDVFVMHERIYKWSGMWPLKKNNLKCGIYLIYSVANVILAFSDMIAVIGNLHLLVENLLETLVITVSFLMTLVIRFHPSLGDLVMTVKHQIALKDYCSEEERYLYYAYNRIACILTKMMILTSATTVTVMYLKPLPNNLRAIFRSLGSNGTPLAEGALVIPFKGTDHLRITDIRIFILLYIYRLPSIYVGTCHSLTICLALSLILHVCGRLAILALRVQTLEMKSDDELLATMRRYVQDHLKLIDIVKSVENVFQYILLFDVVQTSLRLGLSSYVALTSKDAGSEFIAMCTFASYASIILVLLYVYCFVGEYLTQESINLTDAYYYCNWQDMPLSCKNSFMICMVCSQNHLTFTAGKFYKFTLYGFTGIIKTSMAYLSMLRTIV